MKLKMIQELSKGNVRIGQLIMEVQGDNHYHEEKKTEEKTEAKKESSPLDAVTGLLSGLLKNK